MLAKTKEHGTYSLNWVHKMECQADPDNEMFVLMRDQMNDHGMPTARVEVLRGGQWKSFQFHRLRSGDIYRMFTKTGDVAHDGMMAVVTRGALCDKGAWTVRSRPMGNVHETELPQVKLGTMCVIKHLESGTVYRGITRLSKKDVYTREEGRQESMRFALNGIYEDMVGAAPPASKPKEHEERTKEESRAWRRKEAMKTPKGKAAMEALALMEEIEDCYFERFGHKLLAWVMKNTNDAKLGVKAFKSKLKKAGFILMKDVSEGKEEAA
jgi:hypothetical protein